MANTKDIEIVFPYPHSLFVNSKNVAQKAKNLGWLNIKTIKKNFTKEILDYIVKLPK